MSFCQMIDKHATSLETQQAFVTFVDKPMVVRRRHLINKNKKHEEYQLIQVILFESDCASFTQIYMNCFVNSEVEQSWYFLVNL